MSGVHDDESNGTTRASFDKPVLSESLSLRQVQGERWVEGLKGNGKSRGQDERLFPDYVGAGYVTKFYVVFWAKTRQDVANC